MDKLTFDEWADKAGYGLRSLKTAPRYDAFQGWHARDAGIAALESEHQQAIQLERAAIVREAADRVEHLRFTYDGTSPRQEAVAAILAIPTDQPALDRALAEVKRKERLATRLEIAELVHSTILQNRDIALHDILTELWKDVLNTEKPVAQLRAEKGAKQP